ncbi:L-rhamnonate dehydratase [Tilletiaria anomala UBC 951]|uniref:L-rhamnonate dehydratase n=1 Tax=Tilletiaria anomala (strain ATCC 24038 / CBS 436.72 / UBC 951) TaxID=1037660 RepID=A0A066VRY4_TILAU|nr:L-rhamnonate dehydratase [Tilletiaria anomala UBC 951]KDN41325.1 L-rhamnonate dehydratase [Tilletiaria anomala UBC 951]
MPIRPFPKIVSVETFVPSTEGSGGDYHRQEKGHWIIDTPISNPMSRFEEYRHSRTTWGIGVLGSLVVVITDSEGNQGIGAGFGGPPACWLIENHFKRFLIGRDPRDTNCIYEQMYKASMFYGRKGLPIMTVSVVDLAIWDLLGKLRNEPVYRMIGGQTKQFIPLYLTGPKPEKAKEQGFMGGKVPLPYPPSDGFEGLRKNVSYLKECRERVGHDFPLMVDCYMSLDLHYAVELANALRDAGVNPYWLEEVLHPDDHAGHKILKERCPWMRWTTGEHEFTEYGQRYLIESRAVDIIQADVMWCGGITAILKIAAMAGAYDIPVVPHGSGNYSYHFVMSQPHSQFCEIISNDPKGETATNVFGDLFIKEVMPVNGRISAEQLDEAGPGFGLALNPKARLVPGSKLLGFSDIERPLCAAAADAVHGEKGKK